MRVRLLPVWIVGVAVVISGCKAANEAASAKPQQNAAAVASSSPSPSATSPSPAPSVSSSSPSAAEPSSAPASTPSASGSPVAAATPRSKPKPKPKPAAPVLELGDHGPAVAALQKRLRSLGYWVDSANGEFGDTTEQAVYALQKAAGLTRDGAVGPKTAAALARGVVPHARTHSGHVIEINLSSDLLMIVNNGKIADILNTSTGGGYAYKTTGGGTAIAHTPTGKFSIYRTVDHMDISPLGELWRPRYFYGGYAVHGDGSVPPYPVSHGCARVSNAAIDWIWSTDQAPMGTEVLVYY